jgi:cell division protease FtsH
MTSRQKNLLLGLLLGFLLLNVLGSLNQSQGAVPEVNYSQFLKDVNRGDVREVVIQDQRILGVTGDGRRFQTYNPGDPGLIADLLKQNVSIAARPPERQGILSQLLLSWGPMLLLIGVWIYVLRRGARTMGGQGIFSIGKSRAKRLAEGQVTTRLADVAGVDEAKDDVGELVAFLRDPERFRKLGGTIPRGVIMVGPPGTGKTLLARAIAGEAEVPFFSISGSDFVEMFVGVGASRVRDLFEQAKKNSPCIIFIDEIDAVGRRRGAGLGGGHDEREQTLNQLLVEMDGFEGTEGVIVIAATNRPDVLDPALLRPGRFDRQVVVPLPDVSGRAQILHIHMRKVPIAADVDEQILARGTPGFSGAQLANLVNEAALFAARSHQQRVGMADFERAKDKIVMGAERRSMVMSAEDKRRTAYHEAGHAIVGRLMPEHDPVHKVSIIPRGRALGVTLFLPEQDRYSASKQRLESQIASLFGGRLAEEIVFGPDAVTTGAQNDIEQATGIARNMVTKWGYSERLGPLFYGEDESEVFLGQAVTQRKAVSEETARRIDEEVRGIIERNYQRARALLTEHLDKLSAMADALVEYETLSKDQIDDILAGGRPRLRGPEDDPPSQPMPPAADDRATGGTAPVEAPAMGRIVGQRCSAIPN